MPNGAAAAPPLTPRHWELLRLVAAGYTNAQIGRRLGVSGRDCAHPLAEHLRQAAGVEPYGRGYPSLPRPGSWLITPAVDRDLHSCLACRW